MGVEEGSEVTVVGERVTRHAHALDICEADGHAVLHAGSATVFVA